MPQEALEGGWQILKLPLKSSPPAPAPAYQQITHLQQSLTDLQAKIAEQKTELHASTSRVQHIAEKAVESASMARAYQGVSDLAMEQARQPERSKPTE